MRRSKPDVLHGDLRAGDLYLLASDGLTGMVEDAHLQKILETRGTPGRMVDCHDHRSEPPRWARQHHGHRGAGAGT